MSADNVVSVRLTLEEKDAKGAVIISIGVRNSKMTIERASAFEQNRATIPRKRWDGTDIMDDTSERALAMLLIEVFSHGQYTSRSHDELLEIFNPDLVAWVEQCATICEKLGYERPDDRGAMAVFLTQSLYAEGEILDPSRLPDPGYPSKAKV